MDVIVISLCLTAWAYLVFARGGFWMCNVRDDAPIAAPQDGWPAVTAIVPARDEAEVIARSVRSLLRQDYPGRLSLIVVDDSSSDGTAEIARDAASTFEHGRSMTVITGSPPPAGWTGKLWALAQGVRMASRQDAAPAYLLLTDADIAHAPDTLSWLVAHAARGGYVLTSLMARLRCRSFAERFHVPAFIYFFQMLFPFAWVCGPHARHAAAAGGCMLVRADALQKAGGIESIRGALIDDCALATRLKAQGPIWLGLTRRVHSLRAYRTFADVCGMVARSAYAQLGYSPLALIATTVAMILVFILPVPFALLARGFSQAAGGAAWLAMAITFQPVLRYYRLSPLWGLALPAIASLYVLYTLLSAYQHMRGRGGHWKGRVHLRAQGLS